MIDHFLNESFETSGEWFLPDIPGRKVAGTLSYTPEIIELHLHDRIIPVHGTIHSNDPLQTYPIVYGITRDSDAMTLLNVQQTGWSLRYGSGGIRLPERLISSILLIGAHIPLDCYYRDINFRIPGLQVWLSQPVIKQSLEHEETKGNNVRTYSVRNLPKESIRVSSIESSLELYYGQQSKSDQFSSIQVTITAWMAIRPDVPKGLEWYFEQFGKISNMLAFIAGSPMSPDRIIASVGEGNQKISVMAVFNDTKYCSYVNLHEFFMSRREMGVNLSDVVNHWFDLYPRIHMPIQLALSVLGSEKLWLHVEFLSLLQALEGLHRAQFVGNYINEQDYEAVKKAINSAIPEELAPDHKEALRSRIRYGNQISLNKRLDELAKVLPEKIRTIILGSDGNIPRSWIDTRNYYTHWDEELRDNVLESQGIYNANVRLRHFLRVLYLILMSIPDETILKSLCNTSSSSQHLAQLNREEYCHDKNSKTGVTMTVQREKLDVSTE